MTMHGQNHFKKIALQSFCVVGPSNIHVTGNFMGLLGIHTPCVRRQLAPPESQQLFVNGQGVISQLSVLSHTHNNDMHRDKFTFYLNSLHYAKNQQVAGSIPKGVTGIFH